MIPSLQQAREYLGEPYTAGKKGSIVRTFGSRFEFEIDRLPEGFIVYTWMLNPHQEILAIHSHIRSVEDLQDVLGHLVYQYGNLKDRIAVEREDPAAVLPTQTV